MLVLHERLRVTLAIGGTIVICGLWLAESRRDYDRVLVTKEET